MCVQFAEGAIIAKEVHLDGGKRSRDLLEAEHRENVHARVVVHLIAARERADEIRRMNGVYRMRT